MLRYITESCHRLALAGDRPDVDGGYFIRATGEQSDIGMRQIDVIEDEGIVTSAVEIEKRHRPQQFFLSAERQNALRIECEVPLKVRFRNLNSGHQSVGHVGKG